MKLTFHGAAQTVTGSMHLIEVNGARILLECGLYQGRMADARKINRNLPFDCSSIDVLVLSHAHIDHSGNIPNLYRNGFRGDIYCTYATRDLASAMLLDSGHIQERDVEYVNKRRRKKGEPPVDPIYTQQDAMESLQNFTPIAYDRPHDIAPGVKVTFTDAGHMLGSAHVILEIEENGVTKRLAFSGDIGREGIPILRDPDPPHSADILIMESTYGGKTHPPYPDAEQTLKQTVLQAYEHRGKVIVPAFAVGRTQQLVYILNHLFHDGDIPSDIPIFVDSPLAVNVTDVFRLHPEVFDEEARDYLLNKDPDGNVFGFPRLQYIRHVEDSIKLNELKGCAIIISASGMVEHGRILHHVKNNIGDPASTILITGWQAPHTLGRRLVEMQKEVRIFGDTYRRRANVVVLNGFSGHADHDELIDWVRRFDKHAPEKIFLVHGEPEPQQALTKGLKETLGYQFVEAPAKGQSFEL